MTIKQAIEILKDYQKYRLGLYSQFGQSKERYNVTEAIDTILQFYSDLELKYNFQ